MRWNQAKLAARKGQSIEDGAALFDDWKPDNARGLVWTLYTLLDATGWAHLPDAGGWLAQDESLMQDLALLSQMSALVMAQLEANAQDA